MAVLKELPMQLQLLLSNTAIRNKTHDFNGKPFKRIVSEEDTRCRFEGDARQAQIQGRRQWTVLF
jgi:hypothetical protein